VARRADRLVALADELGATGRSVDVLAADLTTDAGIELVEQRLAASPLELLVNNAGVATTGALHLTDPAELDGLTRLNVLALLRLTRAALPAMVAARHGGILNVSSMASNQPLKGFAAYAASKTYVTALSESVAAEVRDRDVHVTVLKPGYVWTEMNPDGPDPASRAGRFWLRADDVARAGIDAVEAGRLSAVPGLHWRVADVAVNALPRQLVRALTTRFDAS
jgi:hypothetical protein